MKDTVKHKIVYMKHSMTAEQVLKIFNWLKEAEAMYEKCDMLKRYYCLN